MAVKVIGGPAVTPDLLEGTSRSTASTAAEQLGEAEARTRTQLTQDSQRAEQTNKDNGAVGEGEAMAAPPKPFTAKLVWGGDDDSSEKPAPPLSSGPRGPSGCVVAKASPDGWIRNIDDNLWDIGGAFGIEIVQDNYDGVARHKVLVHVSGGPKCVFVKSGGGRSSAEACRDEVAARVGAAKGYQESV